MAPFALAEYGQSLLGEQPDAFWSQWIHAGNIVNSMMAWK